jgi:hypothetical protein
MEKNQRAFDDGDHFSIEHTRRSGGCMRNFINLMLQTAEEKFNVEIPIRLAQGPYHGEDVFSFFIASKELEPLALRRLQPKP